MNGKQLERFTQALLNLFSFAALKENKIWLAQCIY